jgi:hypothetical protein
MHKNPHTDLTRLEIRTLWMRVKYLNLRSPSPFWKKSCYKLSEENMDVHPA